MKPVDYFSSLTEEHKKAFAERSGSSLAYLRLHLFRQKGGFRKRPGDEFIVRLVEASNGGFSLQEAINYFLVEPVMRVAEERLANSQAMPAAGSGEVKRSDTVNKACVSRRFVGRDCEQMQVGL
jgi:hypothetical protein